MKTIKIAVMMMMVLIALFSALIWALSQDAKTFPKVVEVTPTMTLTPEHLQTQTAEPTMTSKAETPTAQPTFTKVSTPRIWDEMLNGEEVRELARNSGFPENVLDDLECMVYSESSNRPWVKNGKHIGLNQISLDWSIGHLKSDGTRFEPFAPHWTEDWLLDAQNNMDAAFVIWDRNKNFNHWQGYVQRCN